MQYNQQYIITQIPVCEAISHRVCVTHIRKLRKRYGFTQEQLADKAGMHFTYIGQIERGVRNPSLVNLQKLSKALRVNASELFPF